VIWTIEYHTLVQKEMRKLNPEIRRRIRAFLHERLAVLDDPRQTGSALQGSELGNFWRYRVGDYRIYRITSLSCWWSKSAIAAKFTVRHS